jgi:hypothetical protein
MYIGAVLAALLVLALPALAIQFKHGRDVLSFMRPKGGFLWDLAASELGVATVTYLSKFTGYNTTTPPTAPQAAQLTTQVAQIFWADTDTEAIVIHNWGFALGPSFASFFNPMPVLAKALGQGAAFNASYAANITFGWTNSLQFYLEKPAGAPGGTFILYLINLQDGFLAKA